MSLTRSAGMTPVRRRFVPHVTLARFRDGDEGGLPPFLSSHGALTLGPVPVTAVTLFASHLRPSGARYEALADYPLFPRQS